MGRFQAVRAWPDLRIGLIAGKQLGLITHRQLMGLGVTRAGIDNAVRRSRVVAIHRGVYAVGHLALPPLANELAAVLACGPNAYLSHQSAAALYRLLPQLDTDVHVTVVASGAGRRRQGIRVHSVASLHRPDVSHFDVVPITSAPRTLLDVAASLARDQLADAYDEAVQRKLVTSGSVRATLERHPHRRGAARLAALAQADRARSSTRSKLERQFLALVRKARMPVPQVNARLGRFVADFLWSSEKIIVEIDGWEFHRSRASFESDRRRDAELHAAGYVVLRFTSRQLAEEPELILVRVAQVMAQRG